MSWFTGSKPRAHIIRDNNGVMVGRISARAMVALMEGYSHMFSLNKERTKYVYNGGPDGEDGMKMGDPDVAVVYLWAGFTINAAAE